MIEDKNKYYEKSTRLLLKQLDEMNLDKITKCRAQNFTLAIRDAIKISFIQQQTFNISEYQSSLNYHSVGFCRVASLAFINLISEHGRVTQDWGLYVTNDKNLEHHFLKYEPDDIVFDLTFDQFTVDNINIPYKNSHRAEIGLVDVSDPARTFYKAAKLNKLKPLKLPNLTYYEDR